MSRARRVFCSCSLAVAVAAGSAPGQAEPFAYINNSLSNTVTVIDTATNSVVATVVVGEAPQATVWSRDGSKAYVSISGNGFESSLAVLDAATHAVIGSVPVGPGPLGLDITPGGKLFVTGPGQHILPPLCRTDGVIAIVDTATDTLVGTTPLGMEQPWGVLAHPLNGKVYTTIAHHEMLGILDAETGALLESISLGDECGRGLDHHPVMMALHPNGTTLYINRMHSSSLVKFDLTTNTVLATKDVSDGLCPNSIWCSHPHGIVVHPDGTRVYTANFYASTISVHDADTLETLLVVPGGRGSKFIDILPDGSALYVINYYLNNVWVMDPDTLQRRAIIATGLGPEATGRFIGPIRPPLVAAGAASGVTARLVTCRNDTAHQTLPISEPGLSWDCVAAGLPVNRGDTVSHIISGVARSTEIAGTVSGMTLSGVSCENSTDLLRGQGTFDATNWSCNPIGFGFGDRAVVTLRGTVN